MVLGTELVQAACLGIIQPSLLAATRHERNRNGTQQQTNNVVALLRAPSDASECKRKRQTTTPAAMRWKLAVLTQLLHDGTVSGLTFARFLNDDEVNGRCKTRFKLSCVSGAEYYDGFVGFVANM
jgi:hypothetical protein